MSTIYATNSGTTFELTPAGNHVAICYQMIEIGTVKESFQGKSREVKKVRIGWELSDELMEDGRPFAISREFTLSMHKESALRKILASWRGKDFTQEQAEKFDITVLIGQPCMLNVTHNPGIADSSKIYAKVENASPLPKALKKPKQTNPSQILAYSDFDTALFEKLPDFLKAKIIITPEYQAMKNGVTLNNQPETLVEDDLPF
jgi:hypothetical protein